MSAPAWLRWMLAAAMLAVVGYHLARLVVVHRQVDVELGHAAMGAAMVPMLVTAAPSGSADRGLVLAFAAAAAWFGVRSVRRYVLDGPRGVGPLAAPMVGSAAMAYLLAGAGHPSAMTGMSGSSILAAPTLLAAALGLTLAGLGTSTVWSAAVGGRPRTGAMVVGDRALAVGCGLAVNLTTVYMLAAM